MTPGDVAPPLSPLNFGDARRRIEDRDRDLAGGRVAVVLPRVLVERARRLGVVVEQRHAVRARLGRRRCRLAGSLLLVLLLLTATADDRDDRDHDDDSDVGA